MLKPYEITALRIRLLDMAHAIQTAIQDAEIDDTGATVELDVDRLAVNLVGVHSAICAMAESGAMDNLSSRGRSTLDDRHTPDGWEIRPNHTVRVFDR